MKPFPLIEEDGIPCWPAEMFEWEGCGKAEVSVHHFHTPDYFGHFFGTPSFYVQGAYYKYTFFKCTTRKSAVPGVVITSWQATPSPYVINIHEIE